MTLRVPADLPVLEEWPRRGEALEGHDRPAPAGGGTVAPAESLRAPSPPPSPGPGAGQGWDGGGGWGTDGQTQPDGAPPSPSPAPGRSPASASSHRPQGPAAPPSSVTPHFGRLPVREGVPLPPLSAQSDLSQRHPSAGATHVLPGDTPAPRPIPFPPPQPRGHPRDRKPCRSSLAKAGTSGAASSGVCCFTSLPARPPCSWCHRAPPAVAPRGAAPWLSPHGVARGPRERPAGGVLREDGAGATVPTPCTAVSLSPLLAAGGWHPAAASPRCPHRPVGAPLSPRWVSPTCHSPVALEAAGWQQRWL